MRINKLLFILCLPLFALQSCALRTGVKNNTVFDVSFKIVSAGNYALSEWGLRPPGYEDYYASYVKTYQYRFFHDGSVVFDATYGFTRAGESNTFVEHESGTYYASVMGPKQTITLALASRATVLTWEPNPRDPTGSLVFRVWEKRIMDFESIDDTHPAKSNVELYVVLLSQSISPTPL